MNLAQVKSLHPPKHSMKPIGGGGRDLAKTSKIMGRNVAKRSNFSV